MVASFHIVDGDPNCPAHKPLHLYTTAGDARTATLTERAGLVGCARCIPRLTRRFLPTHWQNHLQGTHRAMAKKTKKAAKYVYFFGGGKADGNGQQKPLLGGKGANLHEMTRIGLPVPPGFTITTELCTYYYANKKTYPKILKDQIKTALTKLEEVTGKKFGDREDPLLVSVRSGARESMPGMMDTILNLGLNDQTVEVLGAKAS